MSCLSGVPPFRAWSSARFGLPLPPDHRFPIAKYAAIREAIVFLVPYAGWPTALNALLAANAVVSLTTTTTDSYPITQSSWRRD